MEEGFGTSRNNDEVPAIIMFIFSDHTVLLTMMNCDETHSLSQDLSRSDTIHVGISELGCQRFTVDTGLLVPVTSPGNSIAQLLADLRDMDTLTWKSFVIIHDDSISKDMGDTIHEILAKKAAISMFDLG